jgi:hypothetical protein
MNQDLRNALKLKYEGDLAAAKVNIKVYLNRPAGIGEHSDIVGAIDEEVTKASTAYEKLQFLNDLEW